MFSYQPRVKVSASTDSAGAIILGLPIDGFDSLYPGGQELYMVKYLLEDPATGAWEMGDYTPNHLNPAFVRVPNFGSSVPPDATGLIFSVVAPPSAYVACHNDINSEFSPSVQSLRSLAAGSGASVSADAPESSAVGVNAHAEGSRSLAVGYSAIAGSPRTSAVGANSQTGDYFEAPGSTAVGYASRTVAPGGVALGNYHTPHLQTVPVRATAVVDFVPVDSVASGGTFPFWCVSDGGVGQPHELSEVFSYGPSNLDTYVGVTRVQGTVVASATSALNEKIFNVDYAFKGTTLLYSSFTALHTGGNNPAISLSLGTDLMLRVTNPAIAGLKIAGLLLVSNVVMA